MRKIICIVTFSILGFIALGQEAVVYYFTASVDDEPIDYSHKVRIRKGLDTANVTFKEIFQFWQSYQNDLMMTGEIGRAHV